MRSGQFRAGKSMELIKVRAIIIIKSNRVEVMRKRKIGSVAWKYKNVTEIPKKKGETK